MTEGNDEIKLTQEEMDCIIYDAREGDLSTLQEIFDEIPGRLLLGIKDDITLSTPVHMAAGNGHLEVLKFLFSLVSELEAKQLASQPNESGNTPLHWASFNGHLEIVQLLCQNYDADVYAKNESGHDAMYEAENNNQEKVENWLLNQYAVEDCFNVSQDDKDTKITYTPGNESKEAEEHAKNVSTTQTNDLEAKTQSLNIQ